MRRRRAVRTPQAERATGPGRRYLAMAVLLAAMVLASVVGCGRQDEADTADGDHSTAMAPGSALDPPALADLPVDAVTGGVPVLCYHYLRGAYAPGYALRVLGAVLLGLPSLGPREFWTTPATEFERHLRYFRDEGISVVTLDEVADRVLAGRPLPARAVVLTFDDADHSVYRHAFPLLRKYGVRAHLFVPTAQIGRQWSGLRVCNGRELTEMAASGLVLLESHTHDLHYKLPVDGTMRPAFLAPEAIPQTRRPAPSTTHPGPLSPVARDLEASRARLGELWGTRARWLAWPYGFASAELDSLGREVGFRGTVSLSPRRFAQADTTLCVGRFALTAHSTRADLEAVLPPRARPTP